VVGGRRLLSEHVDPGREQVTALERGGQRGLVDDAAARGVHHDRRPAAAAPARRADHPAGLVGERRVQREHVGAPSSSSRRSKRATPSSSARRRVM
jgi:hypothetical protein